MSATVKERVSSHAGVDHCMHALFSGEKYRADHGNVHYERTGYEGNPTVFSYGTHWPLAVMVDPDTILVNIGKNSVSTARHKSAVRSYLHMSGFRHDEDTPERPVAQTVGTRYGSRIVAVYEFVTYRRIV